MRQDAVQYDTYDEWGDMFDALKDFVGETDDITKFNFELLPIDESDSD